MENASTPAKQSSCHGGMLSGEGLAWMRECLDDTRPLTCTLGPRTATVRSPVCLLRAPLFCPCVRRSTHASLAFV